MVPVAATLLPGPMTGALPPTVAVVDGKAAMVDGVGDGVVVAARAGAAEASSIAANALAHRGEWRMLPAYGRVLPGPATDWVDKNHPSLSQPIRSLSQPIRLEAIGQTRIGSPVMSERRIVLVTGGGSGFGAAICRRLARDGDIVVVNDLGAAAADAVAAAIGGESAPFDVSQSAAVDAAIDAVVARHGRIDVLVNNAGIAPSRPEVSARALANAMRRMNGEPIEVLAATSTLSDEAWDRMIRVHLYGTFYCTRAALRHMEPARRGAIVNLASIAGLQAIPGAPDYSAAKGGIVTFTRSVGGEVAGLGIRVNAIAPAYFDTPLLDEMLPEQRALLTMAHASGRMGRAEELAEMVAWLASDAASFCFGEVHTISGGYG